MIFEVRRVVRADHPTLPAGIFPALLLSQES